MAEIDTRPGAINRIKGSGLGAPGAEAYNPPVSPFAVGEIVTLVSGGPPMTVVQDRGHLVDVMWMAFDELQTAHIPRLALKLAEMAGGSR